MMRENKDIVRMTKKQGRFFDGLDLEKQSSLEGLLECSLNQFNEFEPVALLQQIKEGMLDVYEEIACDDVWEQSMGRGRLEIGMGTSFTESAALDWDVRSNED